MTEDVFKYTVHPKCNQKLYRKISSEKQDIIHQIIIYLSALAIILAVCLIIKDLFMS